MTHKDQSTSLQATVIVLTMLCFGLAMAAWLGYSEAQKATARAAAAEARFSGNSEEKSGTEREYVRPAATGHSPGDAIIVASIAGAIFGYLYLKYQLRQKRLEILHQERLTAMEKDMALPDLDPPEVYSPPDPHVPLIIGIVLAMFGVGTMIALSLVLVGDAQRYWVMPLPIALIGVGLILAQYLTTKSEFPRK